jgi:serine/threonine protein kinase
MNAVKVGKEKEKIFLKDLKGQGSMADVFLASQRGKEIAVKIYRYDDPKKEELREVRAKKIPKMASMTLPDKMFPPKQVVYSYDKEKFLGFTMDLFPKGYFPLGELYSPDFWAKQFMTPSKALIILKGVHDYINEIHMHKAGLVIVDLNPGNAQFSMNGSVIGGDSDSYQIPGFFGREFHPDYVSPRLIGKILGNIEILPEDDLFSYYIHYLTGLTRGGHPFRGKGKWFKTQKKKYPEVSDRMLAGISIFHEQAETVGKALPIEILPDDVLHHLYQVLVVQKKANGPMPEYCFTIKFQRCPACDQEHARNSCPLCHKVVVIPKAIPALAKMIHEIIFESKLAIVETRLINNELIVITREKDSFKLQKINFEGKTIFQKKINLLLDSNQEYVIKIGDDLIGIADINKLYVFDHQGKEVERTTTTKFMNKQIFALGEKLYRGAGAQIMAWEKLIGTRWYKPVAAIISSTWYKAVQPGLVIMSYINGKYDWMLLQGINRRKMNVQSLKNGQYILHYNAISDGNDVVTMRVVEDSAGKVTTLIDKYSLRDSSIYHFNYPHAIYQAEYNSNVILFASDEGLMRWKLGENPRALPNTEDLISDGDKVLLKDKGTIILVKNQTIEILRAH